MTGVNVDQTAHWNNINEMGHWVTEQAHHDRMLAVFSSMLFEATHLVRGERVLDVRCGCGATTRAAAELVAPGSVLGVDLSAAMLARARTDARSARLDNVVFEQADAQVHSFEASGFDVTISRFGLMFFDDPVAAFANLHTATRAGGRLVFVCWQPLAN